MKEKQESLKKCKWNMKEKFRTMKKWLKGNRWDIKKEDNCERKRKQERKPKRLKKKWMKI
jgi:hypothetical protein